MSPALSSTLAIALCVVVLAPLAWAMSESRSKTIAVAYIAFIFIVMGWNIGFFQRSSLAATDVVVRAVVPGNDGQCREVLELMNQAGLSVDRSDLSAPRIVGNGASQIPSEIGEVLIRCSETQAPSNDQASTTTDAPPIVPET